ncbi:peptide chain release factor N(5)-glutamine methyltransferase [Rhodobaculum claviforme]|uniref:Release factor glutamine methyltransferase n=1 Tax=Rhodobaculum claviforme TaxID=1549854 RepID=A0A934THZ6_9RHOB|nr:peptide chain release factor N(5)-glutamine methyltransferase [Rhodobaculum claviforme]MBK5926064.1 protein-(glutamine-N5) methyltransferase, release factor-specific [Rhodobaculum claviforme]
MSTVAAALRNAAARLRAAGIDDPAGDARRLVAHALGWPPARLVIAGPDPLPPEAAAPLEAALAARCAHRPVAQILGWRAFWRHAFEVTPDVLDPRPETEVLVAAALEGTFARVLDLGTGSGCVLLSLLAERPAARGLGIDVSDAALAVARRNAARLGLSDRATLRHGDWLAGVSGPFDLIVSNPPYLAAHELAGLAPEVRDWEPAIALSPGGDGLDAYRAIAAGAAAVLAPGGVLAVEIGPTQAEAVAALMRSGGLAGTQLRRDLDGRARVVLAHRPAPQGDGL